MGRQLPVTVALANVLERSFPEEYEARRLETRLAADSESAAGEAAIPLFVMSCVMPGAPGSPCVFLSASAARPACCA